MNSLPNNPSKATIARNPHIYGVAVAKVINDILRPEKAKPFSGVKQRSKPPMNHTEHCWYDVLCDEGNPFKPFIQAVTFRLANGVTYTPDFFAFEWPGQSEFDMPTAWEVKGKHAWDDAIVKLKLFARLYPQVRVILVWNDKEKGWQTQRIKP